MKKVVLCVLFSFLLLLTGCFEIAESEKEEKIGYLVDAFYRDELDVFGGYTRQMVTVYFEDGESVDIINIDNTKHTSLPGFYLEARNSKNHTVHMIYTDGYLYEFEVVK